MDPRTSVEAALLRQISALEDRLSELSVEIAGLHLRKEGARLAKDAVLRERLDERMQVVETELSRVQLELLKVEKRYHALEPLVLCAG